jgi:hypothetical protein
VRLGAAADEGNLDLDLTRLTGSRIGMSTVLSDLPPPVLTLAAIIALLLTLAVTAATFSRRPEPAERLRAFGELLIDLVRGRRR